MLRLRGCLSINYMTRITKVWSRLSKYFYNFFKKVKYKKFLPSLYTKLVILGFTLTGLKYTLLPKLEICSSIFGDNECDPLGNFIVTYASFPGYLFSSFLLFLKPKASAFYLISGIFLISLLFYFLIGVLIDKLKQKKIKILSTQTLVFLLFIVLIILLLILILNG